MVPGEKYGTPRSIPHQNDRKTVIYTMRWYNSNHVWVLKDYVVICLLGVFRLCRVLEIGSDKLGNKLVCWSKHVVRKLISELWQVPCFHGGLRNNTTFPRSKRSNRSLLGE